MKRWAGIVLIVAGVALVERRHAADRARTGGGAGPMKWLLIGIIVAATTAGEVLQAAGMRRHGEIRDFRPGAIRRAVAVLARNRFVIGPWRPWRSRSSPTWGC